MRVTGLRGLGRLSTARSFVTFAARTLGASHYRGRGTLRRSVEDPEPEFLSFRGALSEVSGISDPENPLSAAHTRSRQSGNKSSLVEMSSAPEPPAFKNEPPKEKDFQNPGLRGVRTTTLFRAVNPELFIKPNKPVMAFGLVTLSLCVAYIGYLHATQENKMELYEAIDSEGHSYMRRKTSKWD